MRILRTKSYTEREAYIEGYKDGAEQALNDSIKEAVKIPEVKENGKAVKEMLDKVEEMKSEVPEIAKEAANAETCRHRNRKHEYGCCDQQDHCISSVEEQ